MSEIQKEERRVEVFIVDNKEFATLKEAKAYIKERDAYLQYTYYTVYTHFDFSEGRGYQRRVLIAVPGVAKDSLYYKMSLVVDVLQERNDIDSGMSDYYGQSDHETWKVIRQDVYENYEQLRSAIATHQEKSGGIMKAHRSIYFAEDNGMIEEMDLKLFYNTINE